MKWYSEKLYGFILVMLKIWKYTALPTYSLENQCSSPVVVKKTGFHFLILIFTLGNIILYITYYGVDSSLKASSYFFQFCTICTYNTCLISVLHMKRKKMATLLINIFSIESHALKLFHNSNCSDVSKYFTKYAAAKFCIIVMILYGDFYYFINNTKDLVLREPVSALDQILNPLKFTVWGSLPLNWTIIYTMIVAIITYLTYIIQFSKT
ncbi:uncharacterized protein [Tenebrio molitor]|uniref:uncharacterized protein n=1 Tax=Tenebrio molitor TaxID=7067 RepID=UPI0036248F06